MVSGLLSTARELPRLREISMVFVRHGLGDLVRRAGIATLLEHAGHVLHWGEATKIAYLEVQQRARLGARLISGEGAIAERCCFGVLVCPSGNGDCGSCYSSSAATSWNLV